MEGKQQLGERRQTMCRSIRIAIQATPPSLVRAPPSTAPSAHTPPIHLPRHSRDFLAVPQ